ncbi:MAG: PAS domain S-box protein [Gorillibacterium sp.]|nr:PAS domain S-box protein [Gorillibacterium sp.]
MNSCHEDDILRLNIYKDMLAQLFAGIPDLALLLKVEAEVEACEHFRYILLNPAALDSGIFHEDPIGKTIDDMLPEDLAELLNERYRKVCRTRKPLYIEDGKLTYEGHRFGDTVMSPVFGQGGRVSHILTVVKDYDTNILKTRQDLKITQDFLFTLMNGTKDGIVFWDLEGSILQVNDSFRRLFHYNDENIESQLTGKGTFFSIENRNYIADLSARLKRGEQVGTSSAVYKTEGGLAVYVDVTYFSLKMEDGEIYAFTGIYRDITREKHAVTASQENERRYRIIAENMTDLILLTDVTGVVQYVSPSFHHLLGLSEDRVLGKSVLENIDKRDIPKVSHTLVGIRKDLGTELVEFRYILLDGSFVWVEAKGSLLWESGTPYILLIGRDVTDHKAHEERTAMLAYSDPLTGAPNQKMFQELLKQAIYASERYGHPLAIVYLDLEADRTLLPTITEEQRDGLLRAAVMLMELSVGKSGVVTRVAGGEFLLLYQEFVEEQEVKDAVSRLLSQLALLAVPGLEDTEVWKSAAGIAFRSQAIGQAVELIESAQMALYRALEDRESRLAVFKPD